MLEDIISLCIPTYQRANLLLENTIHHIRIVGKYNIPFIISNNCSTDQTEEVVRSLQEKYSAIAYFKQDKNIRDHNFPFVLRQSTAKYAWLLGDKHKIAEGSIERIWDLVEQEEYDLIVTNHDLRVKGISTQVYTNPEQLLANLGWHMTDITSLIFSKKIIENIPFERFSGTSFMHTGGIFEALSGRPCRVLWLNENLFEPYLSTIQSGWLSEMFEVWMASWPTVILSLPPCQYTFESKIRCLRTHNDSTFFTRKLIKHYRRRGLYNYQIYRRYKHSTPLCSSISMRYYFIMSITPRLVLRFPLLVRNYFRFLKGKENCWKE
jgi:abequosyltransferase